MNRNNLVHRIKNVNYNDFDNLALDVFQYQYSKNKVYRAWVDNCKIEPSSIHSIQDIPFLPISAFKHHKVVSFKGDYEEVFTSSGTTGSNTSKHFVSDASFYLFNTQRLFETSYGPLEDICFLALLPAYKERQGSSLVKMVDYFISKSNHSESGYFLYDHHNLENTLNQCKQRAIPTILIGVSFALLDFVDQYAIDFPSLTVMETGGMKGRRKEITREELHLQLKNGFNINTIHSEYGMTELFSQAYSKGDGLFQSNATMKVFCREVSDPMSSFIQEKMGLVNIIDLANIDSCAFIATEDLGRVYADQSFEVLGRLDTSDIRGCNLMVI